MENEFFNLDDSFEKSVYERLVSYIDDGEGHDIVLSLIYRDFPNMDSDLINKCAKFAYKKYFGGKDGDKTVATIKKVLVAHQNHLDDPLFSYLETKFHLSEEEELIVAVLVENPFYLYDSADVHMSFTVNDNKVNEFKHAMYLKERRKVYYIPLNIGQIEELKADGVHNITVEAVDENLPGKKFTLYCTVYRGNTSASDAFGQVSISICDDCGNCNDDMLEIERIDSIKIHADVNYNGGYGYMPAVDAVVKIKPADNSDNRLGLVCPICLEDTAEGSHLLHGSKNLFNVPSVFKYCDEPIYKLQPGKYSIEFYIWDTLLWSDEVEFRSSEPEPADSVSAESEDTTDEFDALLDKFIEDMLNEKGEIRDPGVFDDDDDCEPRHAPKPEPKVESLFDDIKDPFEYIQVLGLNLFNVYSPKDDNSRCLENLSSLPQTSFDASKLKMLSVVGKIKKIQHTSLYDKYESFQWSIYDQTGRLVDSKIACQESIQEETWICAGFGDFCGQKWEKGSYRVEMKCFGHTVISTCFNVGEIDVQSDYDPKLITKKAAVVVEPVAGSALARLDKLAGLQGVKEKIHALMNFHNLQQKREASGLPTKRPSLHARFLGNPGTGKTTVARLLGQIYKEMGLLSSGHVVLEERKNMIGRYYDSEGQAVDNALNRAKGGILLIDEAYNLYVENDEKDPGRRILEYLLTALTDENNRDWMLILAGYPAEMKKMLKSNPGIESRVKEIFEFQDFNVDELMQVADLFCDDNTYELSEEARERLKSVITRDLAAKDENFGNARYVKNLMETAINTRMATRLREIASPTYDQLVTIEADDIPITSEESERISTDGFDNVAIDEALKKLDALVGLNKVKSAIHNFVNISRYLQSQGEKIRGKGLLKWNFTGNTGTGKSTVGQILAEILKAMNLIQNSEMTEVKGEQIFNVSDYECNEVIRAAVKKSRKGVLFIDGDAPEFRSSHYRLTSEQIRFKLSNLASEDNASGALIISECASSNLSIAHSLASNGIYDFDHTFIFDDYNETELYEILLQCLEKMNTKVSVEAEIILREYIKNLCSNRELSFANARTMKNLSRAIFETVILRMSQESATDAERTVLACDVDSFVWKKVSTKIGF